MKMQEQELNAVEKMYHSPSVHIIHPANNGNHKNGVKAEMPLITVVIPTYNRKSLVQQSIGSVQAQTYSNWELIVVDDGSTDESFEALSAIEDPRIRVIRLEHTGNIAFARNIGARSGRGEWISFLDSDDIWVPERLSLQISGLLKEKKHWGYGGFELMNGDMVKMPNKAGVFAPISGWIARQVLTTEAAVSVGSLMLTRKLFEEVGGFNTDPGLLYREDYDLAVRLALRNQALAIPELLVRIREHRGRATNGFPYGHDRTAAVYEHFLLSNPDHELARIARQRIASELAESSVDNIKNKEYLEAAERLQRALLYGLGWKKLLSALRRGFGRPAL
jgi:glycosyltransferase involved in cell wall biosynthesis